MDDLVARASTYATSAHARIQHLRKYSGQPYDVHLRAVAKLVATVSSDPAVIAAAWLHDVVEDTEVDLEELARLGFSATVQAALDALTRRAGEGDAYYARVAANPLAKAVKLADIWDNMHPDRVAMLNVSERDRLGDKYRRALDMLGMLAGR